jgi:tripartite-type tricarboxylate transporter receptor subunit TctC
MKSVLRSTSLALASAMLFFASGMATAENYPTKPVTTVVPQAAGGTNDMAPRGVLTPASLGDVDA